VLAPGEERGSGRLVGEECRRELERQQREEIDDGMLVVPETEGRDEHQAGDPAGTDGGHLGRDHPAHRVSNENGRVDTEGVDHVPAVKREVEHVLEQVLTRRVAVTGQLGREHMMTGRREHLEEPVVVDQAGRSVEEHDRRTVVRPELQHATRRASRRALAPHALTPLGSTRDSSG
jgi:hypothetical protein